MRLFRASATAARLKDGRQVAMDLVHGGLGEVPTGNPGLVRHDDHAKAGTVQRPHGINRPGIEHDLLDPAEIPDVVDEGAITIDKHGRSTGTHKDLRAAAATDCTEMPVIHR